MVKLNYFPSSRKGLGVRYTPSSRRELEKSNWTNKGEGSFDALFPWSVFSTPLTYASHITIPLESFTLNGLLSSLRFFDIDEPLLMHGVIIYRVSPQVDLD
jgi:hypothetical protein